MNNSIPLYQEQQEFGEVVEKFEEQLVEQESTSELEEVAQLTVQAAIKAEISPSWRYAVINIYSTKNNTCVAVTDRSRDQQLAKFSGGQFTKSDRLKGSVKVAELMYPKLADRLKFFNITHLQLRIRAPGSMNIRMPTNAARALVALITRNFNVVRTFRTTPEMYGMMRPKAIRRVR